MKINLSQYNDWKWNDSNCTITELAYVNSNANASGLSNFINKYSNADLLDLYSALHFDIGPL